VRTLLTATGCALLAIVAICYVVLWYARRLAEAARIFDALNGTHEDEGNGNYEGRTG